MKRIGDVSRKRRLFGGEARMRWYARCRTTRFARRYSLAPLDGTEVLWVGPAANGVAGGDCICVVSAA
jgi:hypothetical protein